MLSCNCWAEGKGVIIKVVLGCHKCDKVVLCVCTHSEVMLGCCLHTEEVLGCHTYTLVVLNFHTNNAAFAIDLPLTHMAAAGTCFNAKLRFHKLNDNVVMD